MAVYNKFEDFVFRLGTGVHQLQAAGHQLDVYFSNATPSASLDSVKADLAEITIENGYTGPEDIANDYTEAAGTGTLTGVDVTVTASGGSYGPLQYVVLDNDTPASPLDPLIAWWDYGSALTPAAGESVTADFGAAIATLA